MKKQIGKNTLGGGKKMSVDLRTYNRSSHDLSYAWRSSVGVGTLVPCMKILALPGDTFDIEIEKKVMTHPTVGPLFGSYKMQVDIFTAPIRLYQAKLHNNQLNIGMDMAKVILPKIDIASADESSKIKIQDSTHLQISSSSVLAYLGTRGFQKGHEARFNAVPMCAYLDIFKNYYANTQEDDFYWIGYTPSDLKIADNTLELNEKSDNVGSQAILSGSFTIELGSYSQIRPENLQIIFTREFTTLPTKERTLTYEETKKYFDISYEESTGTATYTFHDKSHTSVNRIAGTPTKVEQDFGYQPIHKGKLEIIDKLREQILQSSSSYFLIHNATNTYFESLLGKQTKEDGELEMNAKSAGSGLILKTFQSDVFNNWIKSEWIDGDNGIAQITAIDTSSGSFTIDQLNLSKKVYDMLNRIAISGGTYQDWVQTVYTSNWEMHTETPVYEGGMSCEIEFQEVVSNSATESEPLGTLAGRGADSKKKGGVLHVKVKEPCYLMGIVSITPRVDYCQGNDWDVEEIETMDDLHKPQLDGIGYQSLMDYTMGAWSNRGKSTGFQPAWINYMTNFNKTYGTFAEDGNEAFMVLNKYYEIDTEDETNVTGKSSYINPSDFNYIFAETTAESQNFWVQLGFAIKARRVMSAKQIPNL